MESNEELKRVKGFLTIDSVDGPLEEDEQISDVIMKIARELSLEIIYAPIVACQTCGHYDCACEAKFKHKLICPYRRAVESKVAFPCADHQLDVCSECDACDCS